MGEYFDDFPENRKTFLLWTLLVFSMFLMLRIGAWQKTVLLEDTDSVTYLNNIILFQSMSIEKIINMDPDSTPFYPFFGALFSLPGWSVETGARLCSLFFSSFVFFAVAGIGRMIATPKEVFFGLTVLSFSPVMIALSFSVLTEPSYIGTVYFGFWYFWKQHKNPRIWHAGILGLIYGLSFLNRLEGLLYIAIIPFFQAVSLWNENKKLINTKKLIVWSLAFIVCFSLMAAPQIWRVSKKMGTPALNGRQVWSSVLKSPDGKSQVEKIFGLDYSPAQNNIKYLKEHPEVSKQFNISPKPLDFVKVVVTNFNDLYLNRLSVLIGPFGLLFFGFGMLATYQRGLRFEVFLVVFFIGFNLVAPLLHNVVIRHIAVIAPIIMLMEGIGVMYISRVLSEGLAHPRTKRYLMAAALLVSVIGASVIPLKSVFNPPSHNADYSPVELEKPLAIIKQIELKELNRRPNITAQRRHISHFAEGNHFYVPFADLEKFVTYCCLNDIDFVYLKHLRVNKYPFFESFSANVYPAGFRLLYSGKDANGGKIELFRFDKQVCR